MDTKPLDTLIERFLNWNGKDKTGIEHYSGEEYLEVLEDMLKKENEHIANAKKYNSPQEERIHRYAVTLILEPLIGKMKYGKRNEFQQTQR